MVATVIALVASASPLDANPSRVVTAGIVMIVVGKKKVLVPKEDEFTFSPAVSPHVAGATLRGSF